MVSPAHLDWWWTEPQCSGGGHSLHTWQAERFGPRCLCRGAGETSQCLHSSVLSFPYLVLQIELCSPGTFSKECTKTTSTCTCMLRISSTLCICFLLNPYSLIPILPFSYQTQTFHSMFSFLILMLPFLIPISTCRTMATREQHCTIFEMSSLAPTRNVGLHTLLSQVKRSSF